MSRPARRAARDRGVTLIELVNVVAILGMFVGVAAGAIAVVFRTHGGVADTTSSAHDTQQAVSYFFQDVQSGPLHVADYRASIGTSGPRGSGCSDGGGNHNVLRFDTADRRIAYRLTAVGDRARLDRVLCVWSSGSWVEHEVVNVADALDPSTGPAASVEVVARAGDPTLVDHLVLSYSSVVQGAQEVTATPRVEALTTTSTAPACSGAPLGPTQGFQTFVEGDVHLIKTNVAQTLAMGGALSFVDNVSVGQNLTKSSDWPQTAGLERTALVVRRVNWSASGTTASLAVNSGGSVAVVDGSDVRKSQKANKFVVHQTGDPDLLPEITLGSGGDLLTGSPWIGFDGAFELLRACSDRLATLPAGCACSANVTLSHINGGAYEGTAVNPSPRIALAANKVNTLNITETDLGRLTDISFAAIAPSATSPLVINVATGPNVTFAPVKLQASGSTAAYVVWNFPNVTGTLTITNNGNGIWGTLMAPYAHVTSSAKVEGGVVARSLHFSGSAINPARSFEGIIPW